MRRLRWLAVLAAAATVLATALTAVPVAQAAPGQRLDLKILVVNDGSAWVAALIHTMDVEGVPHTDVTLADAARPQINAAFLASADNTEGFYQAVVVPDENGGGLTPAEAAALTAYEAGFGVRQVDAFTFAKPALGLADASVQGYVGSLDGMTATVADAAKADGFGELQGTLPLAVGSYGYIGVPLTDSSTPALAAGATFTPMLTAPIPNSTTVGSLMGVYTSGGVSQLVITMNYNAGQQHYEAFAHSVLTWMTRGVHLGYSRNYFTMHFDDAFGSDARWDSTDRCTPGEDCPASVPANATAPIRMTADDVARIVAWEQTSGYVPTVAFNGYYALNDADGNPYTTPDALTTALVANKSAFHWLNHGYEHVYQGCEQDTTVIPWRCVTTPAGSAPAADGSNITWMSQAAISSEITRNITVGQQLGLPFDTTEYLSGEHSGLTQNPQQPVDNPDFGAALTATGIKVIGADASRETTARAVGSAVTIPRHPTALYYNTSTAAEAVSEYNSIYLPAPAGKCTAYCLSAPLDEATGFASYIVPTDTVFDLSFILSNDPRPFYGHVSNLTAPDYLGLQLMDSILGTYRSTFTAATPLVNLTETQAAQVLAQQSAWASSGKASVTGYVKDGHVVVTDGGGVAVPITVPEGTTSGGSAFGEAYAGERSAWVTGDQDLLLPGTVTTPTTTTTAPTSTTTETTAPTSTTTETTAPTTTTTTTAATGGGGGGGGGATTTTSTTTTTATTSTTAPPVTRPTVTSTASPTAPSTDRKPWFTGAAAATFPLGRRSSVKITTGAAPSATLTLKGKLPAGVTFTARTDGTAIITGVPKAGTARVYPLVLVASNRAGAVTRGFVLTVTEPTRITSVSAVGVLRGHRLGFVVRTAGFPVAKQIVVGGLPRGLAFRNYGNGTGVIYGVPRYRGTWFITVVARNPNGRVVQRLVLRVR